MTLEELDKELASWKTNLELIGANLTTLEEGIAYKAAKNSQLTGITETKCKEAFATLDRLWEYLRLLRTEIDKAVEQRANVPSLIGRQAAIDKIEKILKGQSILLASVQVPESERGLLGSAVNNQTTTPDNLKAMMVKQFDAARDFLTDLRTRWLDLATAYGEMSTKFDDLTARVTALAKPTPSELSDLDARLKKIDKTRASDPFSLKPQETKESMKGYFRKAEIRIIEMERERGLIKGDVDRAYQKLDKVKQARIEAMKVTNRVAEKFSAEVVYTPESTKALAEQLDQVKAHLEAKRYGDVDTGLAAWVAAANAMEAAYRQGTAANEALFTKVADLKGRMEKAKARREQNKEKIAATDKGLARFAEMFATSVEADKIDLNECEANLVAYETRLGEQIAQFDSAPPEVRLARRLEKARHEAETLGLATQKALVKFGEKADEHLAAKHLDQAEAMIASYEVKLGELKAHPPEAHAEPEEAKPEKSRKETLTDRLAKSRQDAQKAGLDSDKSLRKFAEKADEALGADNLDTAENMIYSHETKIGELKAHPHKEAPAPDAAAAVAADPAETLRQRLATAKAKGTSHNVNPTKALGTFETKALEALAAGDLQKAEDMIVSYETKVSELVAALGH